MTIELGDLTTLTQEEVDARRAILTQRLQDAFPNQDYRRGVLGDLLLENQSVVAADFDRTMERMKAAQSLLAVTNDPTLADPDTVDHILSNWNLPRIPGTAASGLVAIVLDSAASATVGAGSIFEANGVVFQTEASYAARLTQSAVITDTDRLLQPVGDGTYFFTVPVVATTPGTAGMLRRGTTMATELPISQLLRVYAHNDFSGGFDTEDNEALLARLRNGAAMATWGGRENIDAMIHRADAFPTALQLSIVGNGDPEMFRDQVSIFPISMGGKCDMYVRTQELPGLTSITKTCTLVEKTEAGGIWQFSIAVDEVPAFYNVAQIIKDVSQIETAGYEIVSDSRSYLTETGDPAITDSLHAVYSGYQTATIRFLDTDTSVTDLVNGESTADYILAVRGMPQILDIQDYVMARKRGPTMGDVLVKAPIPCDVSLNITIAKHPNQTAPDIAAIQNAVAKSINTAGFVGKLTVASIADVVHGYLSAGMAATFIQISGFILAPTGERFVLRSQSVVTIPDKPTALVTGRTTVFIADPQDIVVTITTLGTPEI